MNDEYVYSLQNRPHLSQEYFIQIFIQENSHITFNRET